MEQLLTIFLLYQTLLTTFVGYHYYDNIIQQTQFRKNYNRFIKFVFTTSVGLGVLDYIKDKAPRELRHYITDIINDMKRYEVTTIDSTIQNDIVQLKAEIAKLKRSA